MRTATATRRAPARSRVITILPDAEIVRLLETLSFDEMSELHEYTHGSTGNEAYRVEASEWFTLRKIVGKR